ncbi:PREDICTED: putative uncharacterized protein DDB_G0282133 [Rhagoletis zephyria]|uniref:putative uncharacterized protein DDB_G0282133 n=1 Tax=Rhagoletis zephyria TaxID=28612 RepID=UPI000811467D|nr:PREDICTED: putative uncharacterized protein DDB_G0282133 [Rhagoletis zephyria]XP_017486563.1 PREDICTED: putative uncharacterized protein DDB_G0282133 [Rhagoletis zephyria]XP_017486564.1 PREDICTED: putative uncharacterized protein DDB_G0282133 [Rhagoletis zephyria]XP_017486565.1 PREDICTED: putative uncharacterized protein DDB_G0282133 [Rhagoletis zephyria]XP_017486566.1 PREDICTED: putative uncharacterized protein DDB_G0282133 [Rhagoletis zephyria]XP_017486567.1 PREDICTED: putative uncharacte
MVLASNEWLNTCEDEQKSASGNSQTASTTTATTAAPAPPNHQIVGSTPASTTTQIVTPITSSIITSVTSTRIFSVNNEIMSENSANEAHQPMQQPSVNQKSSISDALPAAVSLNDVNTPNAQEFVNNNTEVLNCDTSNANSISNANANSNIDASISGSCGGVNANINTNNANLYSNPNSNASTLQSAIVRQSNAGNHMPLSCPITPQALSSALQSVMNASKNASISGSPAVGNLPNTFLSTLDIGLGNNASLQQTVKELSSAFCAGLIESQSNMANNATNVAQNVGSSTNISMNLESTESNGQAKIILFCEANSHPFQTRTIFLTPNIECKVGRLIAKSKASESNAIFDCKVLSRNHAVLWYTDDGKFWVKDTKSSNGTFINENKLGNEAAELHFGDIVKFGVDVLENSRKEVHGCIIAFVKLYLPDGREAISIDTTTQRSQYSGEGRISYEEMHRLNLYMQEVSQREKALKSKLFNIQNVLDATRKNSALCWQSLIAEDQLLHRINSLEKKLQIMEKNVPESVLRNEVSETYVS